MRGRAGVEVRNRVGSSGWLWCGVLVWCLMVGTVHKAEAQSKPWKAVDTIELTSGKKIPCVIRSKTSKRIYYYADSLGTERSFARRNVHKLIYENGRAERINDKAVMSLADDDYRVVILVEDKEDVAGLYSCGVVTGESGKSNRSMGAAKKSAETRIKKKAVAKGAIFVLITKRLTTGGYGEIPTYYLEGEAFGTEPPETPDSAAVEESEVE